MSAAPTVYIEQGSCSSSGSRENTWYYCDASKNCYPYAKECPAGWVKVAPEPPRQEFGYWFLCTQPAGYYPYVPDCPAGWSKVVPESPTASP